uniref:Uncharacterized protein n=1 Tax=Anguilla anguilla TaxID=7936 RepID=A0A0E9V9P0_ANGAN
MSVWFRRGSGGGCREHNIKPLTSFFYTDCPTLLLSCAATIATECG